MCTLILRVPHTECGFFAYCYLSNALSLGGEGPVFIFRVVSPIAVRALDFGVAACAL